LLLFGVFVRKMYLI